MPDAELTAEGASNSSGITVIVPAYGPGPHLEEVVSSLERELDDGSRIIISHSGDGDPTKRFAGDPRVTVLHSNERLYAGAARNRGIALARTEWIVFIDEDVVPAPGWYVALRRSIAAGDAECILGSIDYRTSGGYWGVALWFIEFGPCHSYMPRRRIMGGGSGNMAVRRDHFAKVGGFPEGLRLGQDTLAHARLVSAGHVPMFEPSLVVQHHNRGGARHVLRHMFDHGRYSARIRREYQNLRGASAVRWPLISAGMWLARTGQMFHRVFTAKRSPKARFVLHLPAILVGLVAWNIGFTREAFRPSGEADQVT